MSLILRNLFFDYQNKPVLENVSLEAHRNEMTCLLGPNGCGKSTLLKCINNILTPRKGEVLYGTEDLKGISIKQRAKYISYVPQENATAFPVSVIDTISMGRIPHSGRALTKKDREISFEMLELMELEDFAFHNLNQISGGERQRVLIARALAQQTPIVIMDEPTNNLDIRNQIHTMQLLEQIIRDKGIIALVTLHDINLAAMFAHRVLMLKNGHILSSGFTNDVINESSLKALYGVDTKVMNHGGELHVKIEKSKNTHKIGKMYM